jgi:hypothetical protein
VYGAHNVVNEDTVALAARALVRSGKSKLSKWPGDSFTAQSDEGKALIASPIGATIAYMLTQHKADLGRKHITKINLVCDDEPRRGRGKPMPDQLHMFFEFADVPENEAGKDERKRDGYKELDTRVSTPEPSRHLQSRTVDLPSEWNKAWCKGEKLVQGMIRDEAQAAPFVTPVTSKWDGNLVSEFKTWGYSEDSASKEHLCDFAVQHHLQDAFKDLGMDTRSSVDGGPNQCFHIEHANGPAVIRDPSNEMSEPGKQYYRVGARKLRVSKNSFS